MRSLAVFLLLLGGCDLYFGGGDDDPPPCAYGTVGGVKDDVANGLRDPYTGQCEYYGDPYPCDGTCGPCPEYGGGASQPYDWASCYSQCESLSEAQCTTTSGCYVAFLGDEMKHEFLGCFATAPSGPIQGGNCAGLDAYSCSRHDDCSILYTGSGYQQFLSCLPEQQSGCDCEMGYHCEQQCQANAMCENVCVSNYTCANVDCAPGYTCTDVCANGTCGPQCVPSQHEPGECYGAVTCDALPPACPTGTTPGTRNGCYTGYCIPLADCGPKDPGTCTGTVTCNTPPPACPSGTTAGRKNGCWSGYCIPDSQCPLAACATLTTENACVSRADCTPVYTGADCTCYPDHCECNDLTFDRCEAL